MIKKIKSKDLIKANVKTALVKMGVLEVEEQVSLVESTGDPPLLIMGGSAVLSFEQQKELMLLCMKLVQEKELQ